VTLVPFNTSIAFSCSVPRYMPPYCGDIVPHEGAPQPCYSPDHAHQRGASREPVSWAARADFSMSTRHSCRTGSMNRSARFLEA